MYLKHFLLSLIALSVLTFSAAQPLNRSFHRQPINLGDQLLPTSISGSWLIGGSAGQYMGYPVFRPWLALADATGLPVEVSRYTEATTIGAAYLAGMAVGVWQGWDDVAAVWQPRQVVEPAGRTDRAAWARAVERARGWIPDLSALDF